MPIVSTTKMTAKQFLQLGEDPPGVRLELVNGQVAASPSPIPRHSYVVMKLSKILGNHIDDHQLGELHHDVDTLLDEFNVRRPDLLYYSNARTNFIGEKAMEGPPDLAIEVLSPSSVDVDREHKFEQYGDAGVTHYWIIDPAKRTVEAWSLKAGNYVESGSGTDADVLHLPPFDDLTIELDQLWRK